VVGGWASRERWQIKSAQRASISTEDDALWWIATSGRDGKTHPALRASISAEEQRAIARILLPSCSEITIHQPPLPSSP